MTNVVMLSPGYPQEMAYFTRGLAAVGATVIGVGDQPRDAVPAPARERTGALRARCRSPTRMRCGAALHGLSRHVRIDRVECLWEPYMILAARMRESLGLPGMTVQQTLPFRDKEQMKRTLDAAGIRTPWHASATTVAGVWEAAEKIGYPLIVKPIAGAGSADTYRVDSPAALSEVLPLLRHVPEVSVEEFVEAEEFTYDTVCAGGRILFEHVLWYRPRPLQMAQHEWVSPVAISLRDLGAPHLQGGRRMGQQVIDALGFETGFTHMEWYLKADGEVVFGEIGARPPGARVVDHDELQHRRRRVRRLGRGRGARPDAARWSAATTSAASASGRAGSGGSPSVQGMDRLLGEYGDDVVLVDLLPGRRPAAGLALDDHR